MPDPVSIDVVQAETNPTGGIDVAGPGFDPICRVAEDATELCSLIIVGDAKGIVVDTDGDVDDVVHGSGVCRFDLNDVEIRLSLSDVTDTIIKIDTFINSDEFDLMSLPVLKDEIKGKHGLNRTRW